MPDREEIQRVILPKGGCVLEVCLADCIAAGLRASTVLGDGQVTEAELKELYKAASCYGVPAVIKLREMDAMVKRWIKHSAEMRSIFALQAHLDQLQAQVVDGDAYSEDAEEVYRAQQQELQHHAARSSSRSRRVPDRFKPGK